MNKHSRLLALFLAFVLAISPVATIAESFELQPKYTEYRGIVDNITLRLEIASAFEKCNTVEDIKALVSKYDGLYGEGTVQNAYKSFWMSDNKAKVDAAFARAKTDYLTRLMATENHEAFAALKVLLTEAEYAQFEGVLTEEEAIALAEHAASIFVSDTTTEPVTFGGNTFSAAGKMPAGAILKIGEVSTEAKEYFAENYDFGEQGLGVSHTTVAFDLSIENDGAKWQPTEDGIEVTISGFAQNADRIEIVHLLDSVEGIERVRNRGQLRSFVGDNVREIYPDEVKASGDNRTVYYELLTSDAGQVTIKDNGDISFKVDSFSILLSTKITEGLKDLEDKPITLDEYNSMISSADSWANSTNMRIPIKNWKRSSGYVNYTLPDNSKNIDWNWSTISGLTLDVSNPYQVWNGSRVKVQGDNEYYSYNPTHYQNNKVYGTEMDLGQISVLDGKLYDSAVWNNKTVPANDKIYTIYRLRGEFELPEDFDMELWDYDLEARVEENYLYINDDMYVFIYPQSAASSLSNENFYRDFFAYWGGTSAREGDSLQRTFHTIPGQTCNREAEVEDRTKLAQVVDGWRVIPTKDNIGETIRDLQDLENGKYKDERKYYIDIFVSDYSGWGAFYRPVINISAQGNSLSFRAVCEMHSNNGIEGADFEIHYVREGNTSDTRTDTSDENGYLAYSFYAGSRDVTLTFSGSTPEGFENYASQHSIAIEENKQYSVDGNTSTLYGQDNPYNLKFTPGKKTLSFDFNGGTDGSGSNSSVIDYCACGEITGIVPTVTRENYSFAGWKVTVNDGTAWETGKLYSDAEVRTLVETHTYAEATNTTLVAQWIPDVVITYETKVFGPTGEEVTDSANAVKPTSETIAVFAESAIGSIPAVAQNYKFVGWFKDEACTNPVVSSWINGTKLTPQKDKDYSDQSAEKPVGFDTAMGYQEATYYAKFVIDVAPLTIKKTGMDENTESAIFSVTGAGYTGKVTVPNGGEVTLYIPCGEYTISEDDEWTWRYGELNDKTVTLNASGAEVDFDNTKTQSYWLSGDNYKVNKFASKPSAQAAVLTILMDEEKTTTPEEVITDPDSVDIDFVPGK